MGERGGGERGERGGREERGKGREGKGEREGKGREGGKGDENRYRSSNTNNVHFVMRYMSHLN